MNRRDALTTVGLIMGGTIIGSQAFLIGCSPKVKKPLSGILNEDQIALLNEIGETILPTTATSPGAMEVNVGSFINDIISDFYTPIEQQVFLNGFTQLDLLCDEKFDDPFDELSAENRVAVLLELESSAATNRKAMSEGVLDEQGLPLQEHYYLMYKQLTIWGYLSSEQVAKKAFNWMPVPGEFKGCIPFAEGDKAIFNEAGLGQAKWYASAKMAG